MANEGSTKPTLNCGHPAELLIKSVESDYQFCELCEMRSERNDAVQMEAHYKSELARVRGLLQRQWISVRDKLPKDGDTVIVAHQNGGLRTWVCDYMGGQFLEMENRWPMLLTEYWQPLPVPPTFPQSSSLVPNGGAESADIGKLDTADKSELLPPQLPKEKK